MLGILGACAAPGAGTAINDMNHTPTIPARASPTPQAKPSSGIIGYVTIGPNCGGPVKEDDTKCADQPYQAEIDILDSAGKRVTTVQSDKDGNFKVSLTPGTYTLHPKTSGTFPTAADQTIAITEGHFEQVQIMYDTGMRWLRASKHT
jgi:hypothetical protein